MYSALIYPQSVSLKTTHHTPAILIFAHSAEAEFMHKKIARNSPLFDALNQETLNTAKRSGLPYFLCTEKEQRGTTFAERFVNAIQTVYDKGFDNVITIGNDSPQLKTAHLHKAAQQLQEGKTVLGPSVDGGFYLMGLHKNNFDKELFLRLPWQRFSLFHGISRLLEANQAPVHLLPVLHDIDTEKDVLSLLGYINSISKHVIQLLQQLTARVEARFRYTLPFYSYASPLLYFNKGSPSFS